MRRTILLLALIHIVAVPGLGQEGQSTSAVEPEFQGVFHSLENSTGKLLALERQSRRVVVQHGKLAGAKQYEEISGKASPVRFNSSEEIAIVVRVGDPSKDPYEQLIFVRMAVKKKVRILLTYNFSAWNSDMTEETNKAKVSYSASRYGSSSLLLRPSAPLGPGEYCLLANESQSYFCFGVDAN